MKGNSWFFKHCSCVVIKQLVYVSMQACQLSLPAWHWHCPDLTACWWLLLFPPTT
jgi:hypothetical protein